MGATTTMKHFGISDALGSNPEISCPIFTNSSFACGKEDVCIKGVRAPFVGS